MYPYNVSHLVSIVGRHFITMFLTSCLFRSCYVVFPCQQIVLCLGCLMGLVMFARYGEDSPLDKGYVKTNDQVNINHTVMVPQIFYIEYTVQCLSICYLSPSWNWVVDHAQVHRSPVSHRVIQCFHYLDFYRSILMLHFFV